MLQRHLLVLITVVILVSAAGCTPDATPPAVSSTAFPSVTEVALAPTSTSLPPTTTATLPPPKASPLPPTATPPPPPTWTSVPSTVTPVAESWFDGVRVTYVYNAGFLITAGDRRILIDALYEGDPGGGLKPLVDSQPPFDGVDLILATHEHADHFSPELVRDYLRDNPHTLFVSTKGAVEQLLALGTDIRYQVVPIDLKKGERDQIDANGIHVEAIYLSDGMPGLLNLGFIVTVGDMRLFHTGDMAPDSNPVSDLQAYGLPDSRLDVAFVPYFMLTEAEFHAHVVEGIQARYLIPMHFSPQARPVGIEDNFPNSYVFRESLESWILPADDAAEVVLPGVGEIAEYVAKLAAEGQFSGVVLIAQAGEPLLLEAYGQANRADGIPNEVDTKFNLGSMDKMFTAVAILQLIEQGQLSLYDKIGQYLPNYPNPEIIESITIHQLLTHTSGMGNYFDSPLYLDLHDEIRSVADYLPLFSDTPLQFRPGSQFGYSNSGFIVLGLIIEAVTGQSYYDYVRENIFEPSGMVSTGCFELDAPVPKLAIGYTTLTWDGADTGRIEDNLSMMPMRGGSAGGGFSTAPDLQRFGNALLAHRLLSPESTELLLAGKVQLAEGVQYAYGFFDRRLENHRVVGHGGGFPGICSLMGLFLDLDISTIILSNSDHDCLAVDEFIKDTLVMSR